MQRGGHWPSATMEKTQHFIEPQNCFIESQDWLGLPDTPYEVSSDLMRYGGRTSHRPGTAVRFHDLASLSSDEIRAFNEEAEEYGIRMDEETPTIDRLTMCSALLSQSEGDHSTIPSYPQHVEMVLQTALHGLDRPVAPNYFNFLRSQMCSATADVLEFHGKLAEGGYRATLMRFDERARLEPVADIEVPEAGLIHSFDPAYGYPVETGRGASRDERRAKSIFADKGIPADQEGVRDDIMYGTWMLKPPGKVEQRIVIRHVNWGAQGMLCANASYGRFGHDQMIEGEEFSPWTVRIRPKRV